MLGPLSKLNVQASSPPPIPSGFQPGQKKNHGPRGPKNQVSEEPKYMFLVYMSFCSYSRLLPSSLILRSNTALSSSLYIALSSNFVFRTFRSDVFLSESLDVHRTWCVVV